MTERSPLRRKVAVSLIGTLVALGLMATSVLSASAAEDVSLRDARGDAHRTLDITRVQVFHTSRAVRVVVRVRDFAGMDSRNRVGTALGVHFDTKGSRKPDHLIKIDGMHSAAGSTRTWNRLRSNGMDPWGDWNDCFPRGWKKPVIRTQAKKNQVVFVAPRSCLGDPSSVRVAVQSYKPYEYNVRADWAKGWRKYLPRIRLN